MRDVGAKSLETAVVLLARARTRGALGRPYSSGWVAYLEALVGILKAGDTQGTVVREATLLRRAHTQEERAQRWDAAAAFLTAVKKGDFLSPKEVVSLQEARESVEAFAALDKNVKVEKIPWDSLPSEGVSVRVLVENARK